MVDRKYIRRSPCQQPQITGEDFCMEKILMLGESSSLHCYSKSSWASLDRKVRPGRQSRGTVCRISQPISALGEHFSLRQKKRILSQSVSLLLDWSMSYCNLSDLHPGTRRSHKDVWLHLSSERLHRI